MARITLNRPEKRNALNDAVIAGHQGALTKRRVMKDVRVVVISGAGKDFCSGADLSALQKIAGASVAENAEDARSLLELFLLIRKFRFRSSPRSRAARLQVVVVSPRMRPRARVGVGAFWLSGSEDRVRAGDGDGDPATQRFGETRV